VRAAWTLACVGAGTLACAASEPTAPTATTAATTAATPRFSTTEGVTLSATLAPSVVAVGESTLVTLALTNPSGAEITVGLAGDTGSRRAVSGYAAFVVASGATEPLAPHAHDAESGATGAIWAGTVAPLLPIPPRATVVEALGAVHVVGVSDLPPAVRRAGVSTPIAYALAPGAYLVRACVVQPGPIESCAPGEPLTVVDRPARAISARAATVRTTVPVPVPMPVTVPDRAGP
jgi:hypothetical protein